MCAPSTAPTYQQQTHADRNSNPLKQQNAYTSADETVFQLTVPTAAAGGGNGGAGNGGGGNGGGGNGGGGADDALLDTAVGVLAEWAARIR